MNAMLISSVTQKKLSLLIELPSIKWQWKKNSIWDRFKLNNAVHDDTDTGIAGKQYHWKLCF